MKTKTSAAKELISDYSNGSSNLASFQTTPDDIFQQRKMEVLGKRDRSSAGRIDPKVWILCLRQSITKSLLCKSFKFIFFRLFIFVRQLIIVKNIIQRAVAQVGVLCMLGKA